MSVRDSIGSVLPMVLVDESGCEVESIICDSISGGPGLPALLHLMRFNNTSLIDEATYCREGFAASITTDNDSLSVLFLRDGTKISIQILDGSPCLRVEKAWDELRQMLTSLKKRETE